MISRYVDDSLADPELPVAIKSDGWLDAPGTEEIARLVCTDLDAKDPRLSPIDGELGGPPSMFVFAGGKGCLAPESG